jgi:hypothetical protein
MVLFMRLKKVRPLTLKKRGFRATPELRVIENDPVSRGKFDDPKNADFGFDPKSAIES